MGSGPGWPEMSGTARPAIDELTISVQDDPIIREPLELRMLFAICYFIRRIYQLVQFLSRLTYKFR
jgi:hypothetical protein